MKNDAAVNDAVEAVVVELLPSAGVKLKLTGVSSSGEGIVMAHAAGAAEKNFVRLRPGDRVRVVLSARDKTRGRIVKLLA
ncbi:MAG: translation initiation factor IF-1 [Acidobacteriota bacterium]